MKNRVIISLLFMISVFFVCRHCAHIGSSTIGVISSCFLYPVLQAQQVIVGPLQCWFKRRETITDLTHLLDALQKERDDLLAQNIALKGARRYCSETAELQKYNKRYNEKNGCIVQVLAKHFSANNQFFLVDGGSRQGIEKDMIAIYSNCLIGRVTDVYPWYCKVCLITDAECKVAVFCSKTGASGILEGMNNAQYMALQHVSHLATVAEKDMVLSSGEGLIFPHGFALGAIEAITRGDLFYTIEVKPKVDFNTLRYCMLMSKSAI